MNIEVLPVYRSPSIDCLCPLPTGNILSIILNPIINESFTLALSAILTPLFNRLLLLLYSINISGKSTEPNTESTLPSIAIKSPKLIYFIHLLISYSERRSFEIILIVKHGKEHMKIE
jgi:hypothetical protein